MSKQVTLATCIAKMYEGGKLDNAGAPASTQKKANPTLLGTLGNVEDRLNFLEGKVEQIANNQAVLLQKLDGVSQGMDALEKNLSQFKKDTIGQSKVKSTQKDAKLVGSDVAEVKTLCEETVALLKSLKQEGQVQRKKIEGIESSVSTLDKVLGYVGEAFRSSKIVEFILNGVVPWRKQGLLDTLDEEKNISDERSAKARPALCHQGTQAPEEINEEAAVLSDHAGQEVTAPGPAEPWAEPAEARSVPGGGEVCGGKAQRRVKEVTLQSREPSRVQAFAPQGQNRPQQAPEAEPSETRTVPALRNDEQTAEVSTASEQPSLDCSAQPEPEPQPELEEEQRKEDVPEEQWPDAQQLTPIKENLEPSLWQKEEAVALATPRPEGAESEPESEPVTRETNAENTDTLLGKPVTPQEKPDSTEPQSPETQSATSSAPKSRTSPVPQSGTSPEPLNGTSPAPQTVTKSGKSLTVKSATSPASKSRTSPAPQNGTSPKPLAAASPLVQIDSIPEHVTEGNLEPLTGGSLGPLTGGSLPPLAGVKVLHALIIDDCPPCPAPFEHRIVSAKQVPMGSYYEVKPNQLLGGGRFGQVHKCAELSSGLTLAAKIIKVKGLKEKEEVKNEIGVMNQLNHVNLIQLYDAFESRTNLTLIMEYVEGGELFDRIVDEHYQLTELDAIVFTRQICEGVQYLHQQYILHLDLKPENILCVSSTGNQIKIIDFGLARKYRPREKLKVNFGTPEFLAPEVVNYDFVSFPTDMWSVGVITYMLLSGLSPFLGESDTETMNNILHANWDFDADAFENVSDEAKDFISRLLLSAKCSRLSASGCMKHSWLNNLEEKAKRHRVRLKSQMRLQSYLAAHRQWKKHFYAVAAANRLKRFQQSRSVSAP
ncbi:myosin light chain kinase 3 isoform X1 [Astyanax mexicanus]|uniref:myosin light chain kinase 3 isoform X1 n=1 Tax=Astyanax mexicanus TaxID=7994 RepID=UPI0020CADC9A|nr:myosin light chain kinase 3 isoform X1 [Astyanax mexicanus]